MSKSTARILIVDDSPTVVRFVQTTLKADGHHVTSLDNFIQLAAVIRNDPPDLILLDLNIPALSGLTMGSMVRKYEDGTIPIIIYSSQDEEEMRRAAEELGAVAVLKKTNAPEALRTAVKDALRLARRSLAPRGLGRR